ncbi:MAG: glutamine-hydrolyzing carbamoyl-phosphate synthase small subunit [Candidatus Aureabacteria bacterium]|nr:glutamine-hydrolyzing carbamoyl-phosphate synthase small subunit [Candidatus Auribacterota bacterium]
MKAAYLVLEDGEIFKGISFGSEGEIFGEVVFNTSMSGYQEIMTDPSYAGQVVVMTYPLIGNYGVNAEDTESLKPHLRGFIIRKLCQIPSNFRATQGLDGYLKENRIIGVEGIDTRRLTLHIREKGAMRAVISTQCTDDQELLRKVRLSPRLEDQDLVNEVSTKNAYQWDPDGSKSFNWPSDGFSHQNVSPYRVAVLDYGIKTNILRLLRQHFREVMVFPSESGAEQVMGCHPDGVFLSNGPGDPERVVSGIKLVREILGKIPIFGICLGHQILALGIGAKTYKLKFGHRGANQPVKSIRQKNIEITSQNHSFAVDETTLKSCGYDTEITHVNLNDYTIDGFRVRSHKAFCVQYHPESSPGPHDSRYLFSDFVQLVKDNKQT